MAKILITGCNGLVGKHLVKKCLEAAHQVIGVDINDNTPNYNKCFSFYKMDLTNDENIKNLFTFERPDAVFNCFGIKGSPIKAKENPVDFLYPSFKINTEIINQCAKNNIWLVFVSSVGVYAPAEKFIEEDVWKTLPGDSDWFPSWSKRMGEILLEAYKVQYNYKNWCIIRPANIFGEYDDFSGNGTVIASTIKKVVEAQNNTSIEAWGDGSPIRDFVYAGDVADAILHLYTNKLNLTINFGAGEEISIKRMIESIIKISGKNLNIIWNTSKPNGDMRRQMDITKQKNNRLLPICGFENALEKTYDYYVNTLELPLQISLTHLENIGYYWGNTNNIFLNIRKHNEMISHIKSLPVIKDNYKYVLEMKKVVEADFKYNSQSIDLDKVPELEKYINDNNKEIIQKWYVMNNDSKSIISIKDYFRKEIEKFIPNIYTDLKDNIFHIDSLTLYKDGDFIENHADGENVGRRCVILIYLSDEDDYKNNGGQLIIKTFDDKVYVDPIKENFVILDFTKNNLEHSVSPVKNGFKRYTYVDFIYNKKEYEYFLSTLNENLI
jgi:nucleoside-diphosphate-sugar epimerase/Rps23 Pro-64 3,4-dihydroxylase Tpa1-like proline 4-hydroxylase